MINKVFTVKAGLKNIFTLHHLDFYTVKKYSILVISKKEQTEMLERGLNVKSGWNRIFYSY